MARRRDDFRGGAPPTFPPDPTQAYGVISYLKGEGEKALQQNNLRHAMDNYNQALNLVESLSFIPFIREEFHKIICNRSLVNLRMRHYRDAERDAQLCIDVRPDFIKAYWRASQAAKNLPNGLPRALDHIMAGLRHLDEGRSSTEDTVSFLTELCALVPVAPTIRRVYNTLGEIICVLPESGDPALEKVVTRLANNGHWESVSMLITGLHGGPQNDLESYCCGEVNCRGVNVGSLLSSISELQLRAWGIQLAVMLLSFEAPAQDIARSFGKPTLHVCVNLTLQSGNLDLLKYILRDFQDRSPEEKNAQDSEGNTAFHVLILSGNVHTTCGEAVLRLLLNHNCNAGIPNKQGKRPLDLLKPTDLAYIIIKKSVKTVEELRKELETLKSRGNSALKSGNHNEALRFYNEALEITQNAKELYKEAAILYSNKANVLNKQQKYDEALPNAIAAVSCDETWHKGYFWKGVTLKNLGNVSEAFTTFLFGYKKATIQKQETRTDFVVEAVMLLLQMQGNQLKDCYQQLMFLDSECEVWPNMLTRLGKSGEWKCIAYLIFGPNLEKTGDRKRHNGDTLKSVCNGLAGNTSTVGVQMSTVFQYLQRNSLVNFPPWLDAVVYAVYKHGDEDTLRSLAVNLRDTPVHAAVRFSLLTGKLSLLDELTSRKKSFSVDFANSDGDTLFHEITKLLPPATTPRLMEVTELLMKKGYSAMVRDRQGKLPVEYLSTVYPGEVFDLFFKATKQSSSDEIMALKDSGNELYKNGNVFEAIQKYTKAINLVQASGGTAGLTERDLAVLYGNRAEAFLKLNAFEEALEDAKECNGFDGHWFKGHLRVGKALKGLGKMDHALRAFINCYRDIDRSEAETIKTEVMTELTGVCVCIPRNRLNHLKRLPDFPRGQGHLWAKVAYQLISVKNDWEQAAIAYFQFTDGEALQPHIVYNLKPLCNLPMLKGYAWGTDLMKFFLICGSDRNTIQIEKGQPYLHAAVMITLKLGIKDFTNFLRYMLDTYVIKYSEQNRVDTLGNSALHVATKEKGVEKDRRFQVIVMLLQADVDPTIVNMSGLQAVDLLPKEETKSLEHLRMAMYSATSRASQPKSQQKGKQNLSKSKPAGKDNKEPPVRILKRPENRGCHVCEECLLEGEKLLKSDDIKDGYEQLLELISERHRSEKHISLVRKAIGLIVAKLGEASVPEIPTCLGEITGDNVVMIIEGLASKNKWRQMDTFVRKYRILHPTESLKNFASSMSVVPMLRDSVLKNAEETKLQILKTMVGGGATLGSDGGQSAVRSAVECEQYKVIGELIKLGADTLHLSFTAGDTPIHAIMAMVLEKDKSYHERLNVLKYALEQFDEDPQKFSHLDPNQVDHNGDSLFHLVAKAKYNNMVLSATELLCKHNLSSSVYNNDQKLPSFYIKKQTDRRLQFIKLAAKAQPKTSAPKQKTEKDRSSENQSNDIENNEADSQHDIKEVIKISTQREIRKKKIEESIRLLADSKISIFNLDTSPTKQSPADRISEKGDNSIDEKDKGAKMVKKSLLAEFGKGQSDIEVANAEVSVKSQTEVQEKEEWSKGQGQTVNSSQGDDLNKGQAERMKKDDIDAERKVLYDQVPRGGGEAGSGDQADDVIGVANGDGRCDEVIDDVMESEESDTEETEEEFVIDAQVFDNLEWEVECTAEVWKTLRDKHVIPELKQRIVRKIQLLASGEWQPHLCKKIKNVPPTLNLFEAKFSKGSRIMWELAIAFSPRCSETAESRLQPDIAGEVTHPVRGGRIYSEIIRVWDIVLDHDKIYRSVDRIKKSHLRGEHCIIQKKLRGIKSDAPQIPLGAAKRYPALYAECDTSEQTLQEKQQEMQQFFPPASANETEYHILKFYSFSSALVSHVLQNIEAKVDFPFRVTDLEHAIINLRSQAPILLLGRSGTGKTTCCLYRLWSQFHNYWSAAKEADAPLLPRCVEFVHTEGEPEDSESDEEDLSSENEDETESEAAEGASGTDQSECCAEQQPEGQMYDHIHQIFITKNAVLCSEVQKNFRELSHADDLMRDHVAREEENIPYRLQDVDDYLYPLFLTSRQLMLMLDASLGSPYFFERKEDGSLKVDIAGWTDADGPLSILPLLDEDSDAEDEVEQYVDDDSDNDDDVQQAAARKKTKVDPRREITYEVFVDEVWPRIKKKIGSAYHPSLVWMEIMSFIKGSYEALTKKAGYLHKEEYFKLGRKRASNFSGEREKIYDFFLRYQHFKSQNSLFDETDLVHDVFRRLRMMESRPWVIHQFFVDETQDFTQAELCLLIRLCQNPNDMFLTGDTAQSIMRGIAFRFSDLRSLFYHAKMSMHEMGKTSTVKVPKQVYQLTHNYRSHAGILSLASSVLELMVEFFPESFDRLHRDQGLFHGPQPILLESCSFSDLAVLLRGNRRKTSHIEFGAHQAILVVNDAARDGIPEELRLGLILTIYEAKGLEFDDVLLYNFFKDSQAVKEWRVVTEYLERLHQGQTEFIHHQESLAEIDESVLQQSDRPRPLEFDSNLHKVLNSELKHLYTALTRARVNVWIFDEDIDKRAPMFEYFKARKLVKHLTVSEINEESLSETMFAEKSSGSDWVKRGEDFMRHSLYSVAAKCFGMGGDMNRQKVAIAHGQALLASRQKDNPRQMREEFLHAAELYLDCQKPGKAAVCLQNAREKELSAQLFEKLGQYERAAEIYRKMKRPMASSRCYELLGQFNRALIVLYENEYFDMAIDTLKRYRMLMEELQQSETRIPPQLIEYKPDDYFTEERLSYRAAEHYHRYKNEERMLDSLSRIDSVQDRVRFLLSQPIGKLYLSRRQTAKAQANLLIRAVSPELLLFAQAYVFFRAAEHYHRYKNEERMLDSLSRIESVQDRVRFLLEKNYMRYAAKILEENGEGREAAMVMLRCGRIDDAVSCARTTLQEDIIARCLLAHSRVVMSRIGGEDIQKQGVIENLEEAVGMLETCNDMTKLGEAQLHLAELKNDETKVEIAWKAFARIKPFQNEAGMVECTDWLIRHDKLNKVGPIKSAVKGVGHMFDVCRVLLYPVGQENLEKSRLFDKFYGLSPFGPTSLQVNRKEKPICLPMIKDLLKDKPQKKNAQIEVTSRDAHEAIVGFLLRRGYNWLAPLWEALRVWREKCLSCEFVVSGLPCPQQGSADKPCMKLHKTQDPESFRKLIIVDIIMVELEYSVHSGAETLQKKCRANLTQTVECFFHVRTDPVDIRYEAAKQLWDDIMPAIKYPACIEQEADFIKYLTGHENEKVRRHMHNYIMESWQVATTGDKKLKCDAVKSTNVFLLLEFGSRVFKLTENIRILGKIDPKREITSLEAQITKEVRNKEHPDAFERRIKTYFTLMSETDDRNLRVVQCFGRRFSEAYMMMSQDNPNPWEAIYKFSKFCHLLISRGDPKFLPDMKHFLFWVEFYCTIAFLIIAKVNYKNFPDFVFVVPDNYFSIIKFVEATFGKYTIEQGLVWWKPRRYPTALEIQERLKFIVWLISGLGTNIKLFHNTFNNPVNPDEFAIAERLLVLGMTLICNVGKTVPLECEISLVKEVCKLLTSSKFPPRLQRAVESLRVAGGIKDVANVLRMLLRERDNEVLTVCQWNVSGKIEKIRKESLKGDMLFSEYFLNPKTMPTLRGLEVTFAVSDFVKTTEEGELSDEEIETGRKDQEAHRQLDRKQRAATIIVRCARKFLERRRRERFASSGIRRQGNPNVGHTFDAIQVDATMCGICGISFEHQLKDVLDREAERTGWASGHGLGMGQNPGAEMTKGWTTTPPQSMPSSPESAATQQRSGDKSPEMKGFMSWITSKVPFMQNQPPKESSQPLGSTKQPIGDPESRQKLLENIRHRHCQDQSHVQKQFEFRKFKTDYTGKIFPRVVTVKEFICNPDYQLKHVVTRDNYSEMRMDINRLFGMVDEVQRRVEIILASKDWSKIGWLDQISLEIWSNFERVRPYVEGIYAALKKKEEEDRVRTAAFYNTQSTMYSAENWEDELEEVEPVVEEPRQRVRTREFRSRRHRSGRHN